VFQLLCEYIIQNMRLQVWIRCCKWMCNWYIWTCSLSIFPLTLKKEVILTSEKSVTYETATCYHQKAKILYFFVFGVCSQIAFTWFWASPSSDGIVHVGRPADQRSSNRTPYTSGMDTASSESYEIRLLIHNVLPSSTIRNTDVCISWIDVQCVVPFWHGQQSGIRTRNSLAGNFIHLFLA
jgi:hypothetical protein